MRFSSHLVVLIASLVSQVVAIAPSSNHTVSVDTSSGKVSGLVHDITVFDSDSYVFAVSEDDPLYDHIRPSSNEEAGLDAMSVINEIGDQLVNSSLTKRGWVRYDSYEDWAREYQHNKSKRDVSFWGEIHSYALEGCADPCEDLHAEYPNEIYGMNFASPRKSVKFDFVSRACTYWAYTENDYQGVMYVGYGTSYSTTCLDGFTSPLKSVQIKCCDTDSDVC